MVNTVDWIEIRTGDIEKTAEFYEEVFGWEVVRKETADGSEYWIFDTCAEPRMENIRRGAIWQRPTEPPRIVVYIVVEDIEEVLGKVKEKGGRVVTPKKQEGSFYKAYFADPGGNMVGLWEEQE
ncbi:MAG: VOC family protein [Euryarchaeota archaeon]|nr:VOC family protein [Euryarchaeota archaeon]